MNSDWRIAFRNFLTVPDPQDVDPLGSRIVSRYLARLEREKEPWEVQQAEEAIRLYGLFHRSGKTALSLRPHGPHDLRLWVAVAGMPGATSQRRAGKGDQDRHTVLPKILKEQWSRHLETARRRHESDRAEGLPGVDLPAALERKYPEAGKQWPLSRAFPAATVAVDPRTRTVRRHHQHPSVLQKRFRAAV